jgi:polyisoprenoid-binding protein YceI
MSPTTTEQLVRPGTYTIDPDHSSVEFQVKHLGIATVKGFFSEFEGRLEVGESLDDARASGAVKVASINTRSAQRDEHLRSPDFFDAEQYPELRFESTGIEPAGDGELKVIGSLTIRGVTRPVELHAEVEGYETDPWGNERIGLQARAQIDRREFGMTFNQAVGAGNFLVADKVKIVIEVSAIKA